MDKDKVETPKFTGRSSARLDAKGRLRIPAKFKEVLQKHNIKYLKILKLGKSLVAFTQEEWAEHEAKASSMSSFRPEHRSFIRIISGAETCEIDNQDRILIPPLLREIVHLEQEVMFVGMLSNFEIWDKASWEAQESADEENESKIMEIASEHGL